ncbi:MAG: Glycine oxidase [Planctomycetota bacterium]|jgi:glycine/D-amino acid oxidase-like deaminating enzyme
MSNQFINPTPPDPNESFDLIVLGGGIAGCCMAWESIRRNRRIALVDLPTPSTSSRVAAGLITPITGNRLASSWDFQPFFSSANHFYPYAQSNSDTSFWSTKPALRIFLSQEESELFARKWENTDSSPGENQQHGITAKRLPPNYFAPIHAPFGGFSMEPAARLDTEAFLKATHSYLHQRQWLFTSHIDLNSDVIATQEGFELPSLKIQSKHLCLALGAAPCPTSLFPPLPLHPARGDILEILLPPSLNSPASLSPTLPLESVIHRDAWLVPLASNSFLLGATYDRHNLNATTDSTTGLFARQELLNRVNQWFPNPYPSPSIQPIEESSIINHYPIDEKSIINHRAAVRPASYDRHPLIGPHLNNPNLLCFNGLGSKGSLMAPKLASILWDWILNRTPIPKNLHWNRRIQKPTESK